MEQLGRLTFQPATSALPLLPRAPHTHGLGQRTQLGLQSCLEALSKHRASGTQDTSLTSHGLTLAQVPK